MWQSQNQTPVSSRISALGSAQPRRDTGIQQPLHPRAPQAGAALGAGIVSLVVHERLAAAPEIEAGSMEQAGAAAQTWDLQGPAGAELLGATLAVGECEQGFPQYQGTITSLPQS